MSQTKIIATFGPAIQSKEMLAKMIQSGVNTLRFNFSHLDINQEESKSLVRNTLSILNEIDPEHKVGRLADICGPKIRIGELPESVKIKDGQEIILSSSKNPKEGIIPVQFEDFHKNVNPGDNIFIDDGKNNLLVTSIDGTTITCKCLNSGLIKQKKGINLPDSETGIAAITEKDKLDLNFITKEDFDIVAFSFVQTAEEVRELRDIIKQNGGRQTIISKIEKPKAIQNIDEIIKESDAIMIARGDLGIEVPYYLLPKIQKEITQKCNQANTPVITATHMLESMIESPHPTRAEVTDIANAVRLGTDCIMLSAETSVGNFPEKCVEVMTKISEQIELEESRLEIQEEINSINEAEEILNKINHKHTKTTYFNSSNKTANALLSIAKGASYKS